jgi:antitoxin component of RelBE/YafQ-DinJ toxin-antitoxin module
MSKNKTVSFRMDEESYEKFQRSLQKIGLTVTDYLVQKVEEYLNNIPIEEEEELYSNKLITKPMHRALFYARSYQRDEIGKALMEADEQTRYLYIENEDELKPCHVILTQEGEVFKENDIPRSLRESIRRGEALILATFFPVSILPENITTELLLECLYFNKNTDEREDFLEFLNQYFNVNDTDNVEEVLSSCTPNGIVEYVWEYQYNWNTNSHLYTEMLDDLNGGFDVVSSRYENALENIDDIDLEEFEIIR